MSHAKFKRYSSRIPVMAAAALIAVSAVSCAPKKRTSAGSGELVIISPHPEGVRAEFGAAFEKMYFEKHKKKISVKWIDQGGASDDLKYIKSAFTKSPAGIKIDLFYGGGIDPYLDLAAKKLLQPASPPDEILKKIPASLNGVPLYDENRLWFGTSLSGFGIIFNKEMTSKLALPEAKTWTGLADPALLGYIEVADPVHSSSAHMLFEIILQRYGWEKGWSLLAAIAANSRALPEHSTQVPQDVAAGQIAYGLLIDTFAYSAVEQAGGDKLGFSMPEDATVVTPDSIAILKGAPNAEAANEFVAFSLSAEGQKIWMLRKGAPGGPQKQSINKMSIMPEIYEQAKGSTNITVNPFAFTKSMSYDFKKGAARWDIVNDLAGALLIDSHDRLVTQWKARAAGAAKGAKILDFFKIPVSESEAAQLAATGWKDPVFRNKMISAWRKGG